MRLERLYGILLSTVVSEKAVSSADAANNFVFNVVRDASKPEIKMAVEKLFNVKVESVRTLIVKGKTKRTRSRLGKRNDCKKAYVRLAEGHDIDFVAGAQ